MSLVGTLDETCYIDDYVSDTKRIRLEELCYEVGLKYKSKTMRKNPLVSDKGRMLGLIEIDKMPDRA